MAKFKTHYVDGPRAGRDSYHTGSDVPPNEISVTGVLGEFRYVLLAGQPVNGVYNYGYVAPVDQVDSSAPVLTERQVKVGLLRTIADMIEATPALNTVPKVLAALRARAIKIENGTDVPQPVVVVPPADPPPTGTQPPGPPPSGPPDPAHAPLPPFNGPDGTTTPPSTDPAAGGGQ